ncbi:response regulator [Segetibacter sp. 3557_3]|uniref:response regulator n=1 Tax=Segetibacter sp. 3557_3 TaxID=2547429 RepID=UPI00105865AB|nr:response regulator [Segetibacter sp. 3557_3]TDH28041.1 response regulator [Segetibacter sp. 3557_3]
MIVNLNNSMNPNINILIADDDKDDADFLSEGISKIISSYEVFHATDGGKCITYLKTNPPPELIFLDLNMPVRNGVECLKQIRLNPVLKTTWVIVYSTSHNMRDIDTCYKEQADFYLIKPVTLSGLTNILEQLFSAIGKPRHAIKAKDEFVLMERKKMLW